MKPLKIKNNNNNYYNLKFLPVEHPMTARKTEYKFSIEKKLSQEQIKKNLTLK